MPEPRVATTIDAGVAEVRLARPDKLNALDPAMFEGISAAITELATLRGLRAVVLHGEGRGFCAGLDMATMAMAGIGSIADRTHGLANLFQHVAWAGASSACR